MAASRRASSKRSISARWCAIIWRWTAARARRWWRRVPFVGRAWQAGEPVAVSWDAADIWPVADQQQGDGDEEAYFRGGGGEPAGGRHPLRDGAGAVQGDPHDRIGRRVAANSIQVGYIEPLKAKTGITVVRESPSSLGKLRALVESGQTTTTLFELGSGIVLQAKKLGLIEKIDWAAVKPARDVPRGQERVRLRLPVLLDHHGVAQGREGAEELHRVLRHQGVPGQALPARLSRTTACRSRCRRRACRSTSCSRSTSTSPSRS